MSDWSNPREDDGNRYYDIYGELLELLDEMNPSPSFTLSDGRNINYGTNAQVLMMIRQIAEMIYGQSGTPEVYNAVSKYIYSMHDEFVGIYKKDSEAFMASRGGMSIQDVTDYFKEHGQPPDLVITHTNAMITNSKDFFRQEYRRERENLGIENPEPIQIQHDQKDKGLLEQIKEWYEERRRIKEEGRREREKIRANNLEFKSKIARAVKAVKQKKKNYIANRAENYWKSHEGRKKFDELVLKGAKMSLATRKAMGVRTGKVPTKEDIRHAERQVLALVKSGSLSQNNSIRVIMSMRQDAAERVKKKRPEIKTTPSLARVKDAMKTLNFDVEGVISTKKISISKDKVERSRRLAKEDRERIGNAARALARKAKEKREREQEQKSGSNDVFQPPSKSDQEKKMLDKLKKKRNRKKGNDFDR